MKMTSELVLKKWGIANTSFMKGGIRRNEIKDAKMLALFDAFNTVKSSNGDEMLDSAEISSIISYFTSKAYEKGKDNVLAKSDAGRILKELKKNGKLSLTGPNGQNLEFKKEDIFSFFDILISASSDVESSTVEGEGESRIVTINYIDDRTEIIKSDGTSVLRGTKGNVSYTHNLNAQHLIESSTIITGTGNDKTTENVTYEKDEYGNVKLDSTKKEIPASSVITKAIPLTDTNGKLLLDDKGKPQVAYAKSEITFKDGKESTSVITTNGEKSYYEYIDGTPRITKKEAKDSDGKDLLVTYSYEGNRVISTFNYESGKVQEITMDDNRIIQETTTDNGKVSITDYTYNGNLMTMTTVSDNIESVVVTDMIGNERKIISKVAKQDGVVLESITNTFKENGNMVTTTKTKDFEGVVELEFVDGKSRKLSESTIIKGKKESKTYDYHLDNKVTITTKKKNFSSIENFEKVGDEFRLIDAKITNQGRTSTIDYEYDGNKSVSTTKIGKKTVVQSFDNGVLVKRITKENGSTTVEKVEKGLPVSAITTGNGWSSTSTYKFTEKKATRIETVTKNGVKYTNTYAGSINKYGELEWIKTESKCGNKEVHYDGRGNTVGIVVQANETPESIASKFSCSVNALCKANGGRKNIVPAAYIVIPKEVEPTSSVLSGRKKQKQVIEELKKINEDNQVAAHGGLANKNQSGGVFTDKSSGEKYIILGDAKVRNRILVKDSKGKIWSVSWDGHVLLQKYSVNTAYYDTHINLKDPKFQYKRTYEGDDNVYCAVNGQTTFGRQNLLDSYGNGYVESIDRDNKAFNKQYIHAMNLGNPKTCNYLMADYTYQELSKSKELEKLPELTSEELKGYRYLNCQGTSYIFDASGAAIMDDDILRNVATKEGNALFNKLQENVSKYAPDVCSRSGHPYVTSALSEEINTWKGYGNANQALAKLFTDETGTDTTTAILKDLIDRGVITIEMQGGNIAVLLNHEVEGWTSVEDYKAVLEMVSPENIAHVENNLKEMGIEPVAGSYILGLTYDQYALVIKSDMVEYYNSNNFTVNDGEIDKYYYIKCGGLDADKIFASTVGKNGCLDPTTEEGKKQIRYLVSQLVFGNHNDNEAIKAGLFVAGAQGKEGYAYTFFQDKAVVVNGREENGFQAIIQGQDAGQIYLANISKDGNVVDVVDLGHYNNALFQKGIPNKVLAEMSLINFKNGDYSTVFDSTDPEVFNIMNLILASGSINGCKNVKEMYQKALKATEENLASNSIGGQINNSVAKYNILKIKVGAALSGQIEFSNEELTQLCIDLMHQIDSNEGLGNSDDVSAGFVNRADFLRIQLKMLFTQNSGLSQQVLGKIKEENISFKSTTTTYTSHKEGVSESESTDTTSLWLDFIGGIDQIVEEGEFVIVGENGETKTVKAGDSEFENIKEKNNAQLTNLHQLATSLEMAHKALLAGEGDLSDVANGLMIFSGIGTDREDVENSYQEFKQDYKKLVAAANGQLKDAEGNLISFEECLAEMQKRASKLQDVNTEYQSDIATGRMIVKVAPVVLITTIVTGGVAAKGLAAAFVAGMATTATTYALNEYEGRTSFDGYTLSACEANWQESLIAGGGAYVGYGVANIMTNPTVVNALGKVLLNNTAIKGAQYSALIATDTGYAAGVELALSKGDISKENMLLTLAISAAGNILAWKSYGKGSAPSASNPEIPPNTLRSAVNKNDIGGKLGNEKFMQVNKELQKRIMAGDMSNLEIDDWYRNIDILSNKPGGAQQANILRNQLNDYTGTYQYNGKIVRIDQETDIGTLQGLRRQVENWSDKNRDIKAILNRIDKQIARINKGKSPANSSVSPDPVLKKSPVKNPQPKLEPSNTPDNPPLYQSEFEKEVSELLNDVQSFSIQRMRDGKVETIPDGTKYIIDDSFTADGGVVTHIQKNGITTIEYTDNIGIKVTKKIDSKGDIFYTRVEKGKIVMKYHERGNLRVTEDIDVNGVWHKTTETKTEKGFVCQVENRKGFLYQKEVENVNGVTREIITDSKGVKQVIESTANGTTVTRYQGDKKIYESVYANKQYTNKAYNQQGDEVYTEIYSIKSTDSQNHIIVERQSNGSFVEIQVKEDGSGVLTLKSKDGKVLTTKDVTADYVLGIREKYEANTPNTLTQDLLIQEISDVDKLIHTGIRANWQKCKTNIDRIFNFNGFVADVKSLINSVVEQLDDMISKATGPLRVKLCKIKDELNRFYKSKYTLAGVTRKQGQNLFNKQELEPKSNPNGTPKGTSNEGASSKVTNNGTSSSNESLKLKEYGSMDTEKLSDEIDMLLKKPKENEVELRIAFDELNSRGVWRSENGTYFTEENFPDNVVLEVANKYGINSDKLKQIADTFKERYDYRTVGMLEELAIRLKNNPDLEDDIVNILITNKNLKLTKYKNFSTNLDDVIEIISQNPQYKAEIVKLVSSDITNYFLDTVLDSIKKYNYLKTDIVDFVSTRYISGSKLEITENLGYYITYLHNESTATVARQLAANNKLTATDIKEILTNHPVGSTDLKDALVLSARGYDYEGIKYYLDKFNTNFNARQIFIAEELKYTFVDKKTPSSAEAQIRKNIVEELEKVYPDQLATLRTTLGKENFDNICWENVFPRGFDSKKAVAILSEINESSKFFTQLTNLRNRYGLNINWASNINKISNHAQLNIANGATFDKVIGDIADNYHHFDMRNFNSKVSTDNGRCVSGVKRSAGAITGCSSDRNGLYHAYFDKYTNKLNNNDLFLVPQPNEYPNMSRTVLFKGEEKITMQHYLDENDVNLEYIKKNYEKLQPLIRRVQEGGTLTTNDRLFFDKTMAESQYLMAHAMPWCRGSSGIADIYTRSMYRSIGVELPALKPDVSLDLEAFYTPMDEYVRNWNSYFAY